MRGVKYLYGVHLKTYEVGPDIDGGNIMEKAIVWKSKPFTRK